MTIYHNYIWGHKTSPNQRFLRLISSPFFNVPTINSEVESGYASKSCSMLFNKISTSAGITSLIMDAMPLNKTSSTYSSKVNFSSRISSTIFFKTSKFLASLIGDFNTLSAHLTQKNTSGFINLKFDFLSQIMKNIFRRTTFKNGSGVHGGLMVVKNTSLFTSVNPMNHEPFTVLVEAAETEGFRGIAIQSLEGSYNSTKEFEKAVHALVIGGHYDKKFGLALPSLVKTRQY
jgi:hypothetical protein